jgi:hypothetical protein
MVQFSCLASSYLVWMTISSVIFSEPMFSIDLCSISAQASFMMQARHRSHHLLTLIHTNFLKMNGYLKLLKCEQITHCKIDSSYTMSNSCCISFLIPCFTSINVNQHVNFNVMYLMLPRTLWRVIVFLPEQC